MPKKLTHLEYVSKISNTIKCLETYINARTRLLHRCNNCSLEWSPLPSNLIAGQGCPSCAGNILKTNKQYKEEIQNKSIINIEVYINTKTPILHKCNICNNEWKVSPHNVLSNNCGCVNCSAYGFKTDKLAYLYFIQIEDFLKVGITNREPRLRYKELTDKTVIEIKVVKGSGRFIQQLEQNIHSNLKHYYPKEKLKSGNTECFSLDLKDEILSHII